MTLQIPKSINDIPEVKIHPQTLKHLLKGHPWITKDSFTQRFPKASFVKVTKSEEIYIFIHDENHPKVKARLWATLKKNSTFNNPVEQIKIRIEKAAKKRSEIIDRDNLYLVFGEADFLPGLFIQKLGKNILAQSNSSFWNNFTEQIAEELQKLYPDHHFWWQDRGENKTAPLFFQEGKLLKKEVREVIYEHGLALEIFLGESYDQGIYTDMTSIRKKLIPMLKGKSLLNLYAYTGAFSLLGLQQGFSQVVSVDISKKYLDILEKNISLNNFDGAKHRQVLGNVPDQLGGLVKEKERFDFIICDPPSASSDGKKISQAFDIYPELIKKITTLMNEKGVALLALNTHQITMKKFEEMVLRECQDRFVIINRFKLGDDCPTLPYFPEGNYLKIIVIERKS